jgi:hypothetical protein
MLDEHANLSSSEAMYREGGTLRERSFALQEFHEFAKHTYDSLVEGNDTSSLRLLCRLDISVMFNRDTGKLNYFVNEVERGVLVCLFASVGECVYPAQKIGDEMQGHIMKMLDDWHSG